MEIRKPRYREKDSEYARYLLDMQSSGFNMKKFEDANILRVLIANTMLASAEILLLDMGLSERDKTRDQTLKDIIWARAQITYLDGDEASLYRLVDYYKEVIDLSPYLTIKDADLYDFGRVLRDAISNV